MENVSRMKELISRLNQAAKVYYQGQGEVKNVILRSLRMHSDTSTNENLYRYSFDYDVFYSEG